MLYLTEADLTSCVIVLSKADLSYTMYVKVRIMWPNCVLLALPFALIIVSLARYPVINKALFEVLTLAHKWLYNHFVRSCVIIKDLDLVSTHLFIFRYH